MSSSLPPVTLIVLNWNGRYLLQPCLSALTQLDYPDYNIVLADNASTDDSVTFVETHFPEIKIIQNPTNGGFAYGNNAALRRLETPFGVLVNPDVIVPPNWLRNLISPMLENVQIGVAGCKLLYPDGQHIQHAGGIVTHPLGLAQHDGSREADRGQFDVQREVDYVIGGAVALRRTMLEQIGLLDEGFFLYFEDADLCIRARRAGFRVLYVPQATAVHDESALGGQGGFAYWQRYHASRWRYLLKHFAGREIVTETLPAELIRLQSCGQEEQQAVAAAYRQTLFCFPQIMRQRVADGEGMLTAVNQEQIINGLQNLSQQAHQLAYPTVPFEVLREAGMVVERPFTSNVPLLGPLVARFRTAWNNVAARWYVSHLTRQQNEFNQQIAQHLHSNAQFMHDLAAQQQAQNAEMAELLAQQKKKPPGDSESPGG